jgi:hypothetical protein
MCSMSADTFNGGWNDTRVYAINLDSTYVRCRLYKHRLFLYSVVFTAGVNSENNAPYVVRWNVNDIKNLIG